MREERSRTDTEHVVETMGAEGSDGDASAVFVEGHLWTADGTDLFGVVDVHRVGDAGIESLRTYTG
jgi:ketosteroid isomerase-like protein